jgi:hypothetical protein
VTAKETSCAHSWSSFSGRFTRVLTGYLFIRAGSNGLRLQLSEEVLLDFSELGNSSGGFLFGHSAVFNSAAADYLPRLAIFHFAHRARCAAAILFRAWADMVRRFVPSFREFLPRVRNPSRLPSAANA